MAITHIYLYCYTLSLPDALPISCVWGLVRVGMLLGERAKSGTLTPTPLPLCGRGAQAGYFFFAALRGAFLAGAFFAALRGAAFLAALRGAAFFVAFFTDAFFAAFRGAAFFAVFFVPAFFAGAFFPAL